MTSRELSPSRALASWFVGSAVFGAAAWTVGALLRRPSGGDSLLDARRLIALGPLVVVPLGLRLWAAATNPAGPSRTTQTIAIAQPVASLCAWASLSVPVSRSAGALALVWLAATAAIGANALWQLRAWRTLPLHVLCMHVGPTFLPVGAAWLFAAQWGIAPMGFSPAIVLLTAAHFHFAAFAMPLLAGMSGNVLVARENGVTSRAWKWAAWSTLLGPPFVAIGISTTRWLEVATSAYFATGQLVLGWVLAIQVARHVRSRVATYGLVACGATLTVSMLAALTYAVGHFLRVEWLTIPVMIATHGRANVFAVTLLGLLSWNIAMGRGDGRVGATSSR